MRKAGLALPATCFISLCSAQAPREQGWIPQRRVGMDYPRLACKARIRGQVEVICELKSDGTVASIKPVGNPHSILFKAVQENALKWRFMKKTVSEYSSNTAILVYHFKFDETATDRSARQFVFEYPSSVTLTSEECALESSCD